jgi:4-amino-4-deoxy-L-arabinose transferase-like glycosyltransferase
MRKIFNRFIYLNIFLYIVSTYFLIVKNPANIINWGSIIFTFSIFNFWLYFFLEKKRFNFDFFKNKNEKIFLILLVIFSFFLYSFKLSTIPSGLHGDEAETGLKAKAIIDRQNTKLIDVSGWYYLPIISFLPHALTQYIFGNTIFGLRFSSVIFGVLSLPIFYFFIKENFNMLTALFSTIILTSLHWWVAFSRMGINYNQTVFFQLLSFLFILRAFRNNKIHHYYLAGLFTGFSFYLYYASRIVPILITILIGLFCAKNIKIFPQIIKRKMPFFIVGFVLISLPLAIFYVENPQTFISRQNNVYIFSPQTLAWRNSVYGANHSFLDVIIGQSKTTFNLSKGGGDASGQYGYRGRILPLLSLILLFFGIIITIFNWKKIIYSFILIWFFLTILIGSILTASPPFMPRLIGIIPLFALFISFPLEKLTKSKFFPKVISICITCLIILILAFQNIHIYYFQNPKRILGDPNKYTATNLGKWIKNKRASKKLYFITIPYIYPDFAPIKYIAGSKYKNFELIEPNEFNQKHINQNSIYIIHSKYKKIFSLIKKLNPDGNINVLEDKNSNPQIYIYEI